MREDQHDSKIIDGNLSEKGIEVVCRGNRYFVRYDAGSHQVAWREDEISTEELSQIESGDASEALLALQRRLELAGIDPVYYMREWADDPYSCLARIHSSDRYLAKGISLSSSDFRRINGKKFEDGEFIPTARLDNLLDFKEVF